MKKQPITKGQEKPHFLLLPLLFLDYLRRKIMFDHSSCPCAEPFQI